MTHESARPSIPPVPTLNNIRIDRIEQDLSREFLMELVRLFLTEIAARLEALSEAVERRDGRKVRDVAHAVQGAAANLGVLRMRAVAERLEEYVERPDWPRTETTLTRLIAEFQHVRAVLAKMQERVTGRPPPG